MGTVGLTDHGCLVEEEEEALNPGTSSTAAGPPTGNLAPSGFSGFVTVRAPTQK